MKLWTPKTFVDRCYAKIQLEKTSDEAKLTKFSKIANLALLGNFANSKALCDQINDISIYVWMETILSLIIFAVSQFCCAAFAPLRCRCSARQVELLRQLGADHYVGQ